MNKQSTCLLLFARNPEEEALQKTYCTQEKQNRQIAKALFEGSKKLVRKSGLPYRVITEKAQRGNSFAERFTNALEDVFSEGYDSVISIGGDCPFIQAKEIENAAAALAQGKSCLGPAKDGGIYLLAISRKQYYSEDFLQFSWETSLLFEEMKAYLADDLASLELLRPLADIDASFDLLSLLYSCENAFLQFARSLLLVFIPFVYAPSLSPRLCFAKVQLRGPPEK